MAIRFNYNEAAIRRRMEEQKVRFREAIIDQLSLIGEAFVKDARENGDYNDITGNLRSSICYAVTYKGEKVAGRTEQAQNGTDKVTGMLEGENLLQSLIGQFPDGYALIVVAGMDYAASVEARGRDVLTGSGIMAKKHLQQALETLGKKK